MIDPNVRRLLRISSEAIFYWHYAFLPAKTFKTDSELKYDALFDYDLSRIRVKTIRFLERGQGEDRYSRLPELIDYMRLSLDDPSFIWES
jgi:hypothetical protein